MYTVVISCCITRSRQGHHSLVAARPIVLPCLIGDIFDDTGFAMKLPAQSALQLSTVTVMDCFSVSDSLETVVLIQL